MKINTPLPQSLPKECAKAARTFKSFVDSGNNGLDGIIPRSILENAMGFAIFTVFKAGFVFSARGGSGVVIAKLPDGNWSAPSAIGTAGLGVGGQAGVEMTDFLIVLNSASAIKSFMSAGSLTLGGNLSVAIGPLGRNGEALGSVNTSGKVAAMYSYSKTKGLFGGVSLEGSVIVERHDANSSAYHSDASVKALLSGNVPRPDWASSLYQTLDACIGLRGPRKWIDDSPFSDRYAFDSAQSYQDSQSSRLQRNPTSRKPAFPPPTWGQPSGRSPYSDSEFDRNHNLRSPGSSLRSAPNLNTPSWQDLARQDSSKSATAGFETRFDSDFQDEPVGNRLQHNRNYSMPASPADPDDDTDPFSPHNQLDSTTMGYSTYRPRSSTMYSGSRSTYRGNTISSNHITSAPAFGSRKFYEEPPAYGLTENTISVSSPSRTGSINSGVVQAVALFDFKAVEKGDLSFSKGQVIVIIEKSANTDTWWKGKLEGREGIFPANFVEIV